MNITTWRPDTCGCEIQYAWDPNEPESTRIHTVVSAAKCQAHAHHTTQSCFDVVLQENRHKNQTHATLVQHLPRELRRRDDAGNLVEDALDGVVRYYYDEERQLHAVLDSRVDGESRKKIWVAHPDLVVH